MLKCNLTRNIVPYWSVRVNRNSCVPFIETYFWKHAERVKIRTVCYKQGPISRNAVEDISENPKLKV